MHLELLFPGPLFVRFGGLFSLARNCCIAIYLSCFLPRSATLSRKRLSEARISVRGVQRLSPYERIIGSRRRSDASFQHPRIPRQCIHGGTLCLSFSYCAGERDGLAGEMKGRFGVSPLFSTARSGKSQRGDFFTPRSAWDFVGRKGSSPDRSASAFSSGSRTSSVRPS
jgi:hypothetical protein